MYFDNLVLMAVSAPIEMKGRKGPIIVDTDEHPRPQTQIADLTKLKPVFNPEGDPNSIHYISTFVSH